ncbi:MAG: transcription antitermination factor NusB [Phycisphaerae bacterium]
MTNPKRQARIIAMQALCQWDAQQDQSAEALAAFLEAQHAHYKAVAYATQLVQAFWEDPGRVDRLIEAAATDWSLTRMATVERNTMRVAVVELLHQVTPAKVALDEAIEIGKEYGGQESPGFINGVLDRVLKNVEGDKS